MRHLFILALIFWWPPTDTSLVGTTWQYHVTKTGINTMKFTNDRIVKRYDCELDYTFIDTYIIKGDTLITIEKDDSHSEDGGKITGVYQYKDLVRNNLMIALGYSELIKGHWKYHPVKEKNAVSWRRVRS